MAVSITRAFLNSSPVTDFSFRSTAIGIPFATEEDAVTVYDCPEANRYTVPSQRRLDKL